MRIAFLIADFGKNSEGGIATSIENLTSSFKELGVDFKVFSASSGYENSFKGLSLKKTIPKPFWFNIYNLRILKQELKKYDIIHCNFTFFPLKHMLNINAKWVFHIHSSPVSEVQVLLSNKNFFRLKKEFIYRIFEFPVYYFLNYFDTQLSDAILVPSETLKKEVSRHFLINPKKIKVLPYVLNFKSNLPSYKKKKGKVKILFFGRFVYRKGITDIIKAASLLNLWEVDYSLDIYGKGPLFSEANRMIKAERVSSSVRLHDEVEHGNIFELIDKFDIIALPSLYDIRPFSFLEAMSRKKPIVCYDAPFVKEFLNDKEAIKAEYGDIVSFAKCLKLLIESEEKRKEVGQNAYEKFVKDFDKNKIVKQYLDFYSSLL